MKNFFVIKKKKSKALHIRKLKQALNHRLKLEKYPHCYKFLLRILVKTIHSLA